MAAESESYSFEVVTVDRVVPDGRPDSWVGVESEGAGGVELTWEDLWVTTSKGNGSSTAILAGLTGIARPGEVLAIMGPSGCGKSTLLDALSGRLGSQMNRSGLILVNGRKQALACGTLFFAFNGYPCPPMMNPSDHFLRIINKDFDLMIGEGCNSCNNNCSSNTTEVISMLIRSYKSSSFFQQVLMQVAQSGSREGAIVKKRSQASFTSKCLVLTRRSFVNMYRDLGYYWLRLAIYFALCLSIGTVFYDIGHTYGSIQARGSMLMFMASYLTFMAIGGFPSFVEDLKIFHRERLNGHYGPTAFTVANMLSSSPFLLLISIIPASAAYYLVGLQRDLQHFIFFALILYSSMLLVEGLMMIVANIVPDFLMGIITGAGIQGGMLLASGFFRLPNDLPRPVWKYPIYYIAFHKYANQGYYKNEFLGLTFQGNEGNSTISGEEVVRSFWQMEVAYSKWVDLAFLIGMAVAYRLLFLVTFKVGEVLKIVKQRKMKEMYVITSFGCDG